jgi:hypothetical protein
MADLQALAAPKIDDAAFFTDAGVPGGLRIGDYVRYDGSKYALTLRDTWTEGYRSAYETAEIWKGFDEVWVQPAYVAATRDADGNLQTVTDAKDQAWRPIFSVGPDSAFYSPFWRTFFFVVPTAESAEKYKSARDVIDSGLPLVEGPGHTMSIVPRDVPLSLPATREGAYQQVGGPQATSEGYLDGEEVSFLDFGKDNFAWNDDLVVEETPLFVLVYRAGDGSLQPLNVPTVAGTGPLYANRQPNLNGDVPRYGAFWRLYTVVVPETARIFAPPGLRDGTDHFPAERVGDMYGASVTSQVSSSPEEALQYFGRVALNPKATGSSVGCFDDSGNLGKHGNLGCEWLDSQPALEMAVLPTDIERTDITVTCPFISYHDLAVKP